MTYPVLHVTAVHFLKQLESGRTRPCVFHCENEGGSSAGEFVVKLRANQSTGDGAAMFELVGSLLAQQLGIRVPRPAVVDISPDLAPGIVQHDVRTSVENSAGLNFGSKFLNGGYFAWQPRRKIPINMLGQAFETFAFDALIENPDRSNDNPNILENGEHMVLLDHELAFSFLRVIPRDSKR